MKKQKVFIENNELKEEHKNTHKTYSVRLRHDARATTAPRYINAIYAKALETGYTVFVKIYSPLDTPGAELTAISFVYAKEGKEYEFAFDEKFPVPFNYKKMTDEEKCEYIKSQFDRFGGFEKIIKSFSDF